MDAVPYRQAVSAAFALVIVAGAGGLHAHGITDYKPGEGAGPITGSASGVNGATAKDAAPTLERCPAPLGTVAVAEPQEFVSKALLQYSLPSPTGLIRLMLPRKNLQPEDPQLARYLTGQGHLGIGIVKHQGEILVHQHINYETC